MDTAPSEFQALLSRARGGCQESASQLFARYAEPVRCVVRRWLRQMRPRDYETADLEQSVWAAFFAPPADHNTFDSPQAFVAFLSRVAWNKIADAMRRERQLKRGGGGAARSLDAPAGADASPLGADLPGPAHTPSKYVMADERWQRLTRNLPPGHLRILELMRDGYTQEEIAARIGSDRKEIRRLLERLQEIAFPS